MFVPTIMGRRVAPAFCPGSAYLDLAHSLESLKTKPNDRSKRLLSYSDIHNIENSFIANSPLPIDKYLLGRVLVTVVVCPVVHYDIHRRGSPYTYIGGGLRAPQFPPLPVQLVHAGLVLHVVSN